jgi:hypothetical protein
MTVKGFRVLRYTHIEIRSRAGGGCSAKPRRRWRRAAAGGVAASLLAAGGLFLGAAPASASAHPQTRDLPEAIVTLGDSYISGEGGRWQGNAAPWVDFGDRYGTDRATGNCLGGFCWHEPAAKIYGPSYANGCDRSDVAEVESSGLSGFRLVNLACSGAETVNVKRAVDGGQSFKTEAPQADQLHDLLGRYRVKLIVLSIGGNDLRFSPVLKACAVDYVGGLGHCSSGSTRTRFDADLGNLEPKLVSTLQSIRAAMAGVDYPYQLVFQSYPEPVPASAGYRYPESGLTRLTTGGCPLYDADSDWARNSVVPEVAAKQLLAAQTDHDVYLDLQHVFDGHELCSTTDRQAVSTESLSNPISATQAEWVRFVTLFSQGITQESFHPNAFGQQALGTCLRKLWNTHLTTTHYVCTGRATDSPADVHVDADIV